ncbi:MAG: DNA-binding protein WhiA [Clostridiales bacterium]
MAKIDSFSAAVKAELARIYPDKDCCRLAELAAIARLDGTVTIGRNQGMGLYITTEYSAVARKVYRLLKDQFSIEGELTVKRQNRLKRRTLYHIRVASCQEAPSLLWELGIMTPEKQILPGVKKDLIKTKCCRSSYLRGAFLGSGSVSSPESDYHLEITASSEKLGKDLMALINRFPGFQAKISRRKQSYVVYLKESNQIADFLTLVGAHGSLLEFENSRVLKGMKNQVNRLVNCETANLEKTVEAALRQLDNIRLIEERVGLDSLSPPLSQLARLRLENPEINLKELGEMMRPPIGKSGINHRFRKIEEIAEGLRP